MIKIGICGAPSSGKSTAAAGVFYNCKNKGILVELVQEFVREEINRGFELRSVADQFRIFMKQKEREDIVPSTINVLVTDSPIYLSLYYALDYARKTGETSDDNILFLLEQVFQERDRYDHVIMLKRTKPYINDGTRKQTADESDNIHNELCMLFDLFGIKYEIIDGDKAVDYIMELIDRNP